MLRASALLILILGGRLGLSMWLDWLAIIGACVVVMGPDAGVIMGFAIGKVTYVPMLIAILFDRRGNYVDRHD